MKIRFAGLLVLVLALTGLFPGAVQADGIIIPEPPICPQGKPCPPPPHPIPLESLAVKYHHVTVTIQDQLATTHVDQVFFNPNDSAIEGDYIFPLPLEATVSHFVLWEDGKPVEGQVLDATQARQKYEEIVRSQRDPALLEYAGRGAVEAHIFPIPPQGKRRIELEYTQVLTADNGLVRYVYPLNTEKFSALPLEDVSISVQISASQPIRAAYSPTHTVSVTRTDDRHVTAGYEAANLRPDTDFALYYSIGQSQAFHLVTYRDPTDPADPDGFFLLLLAPQPDVSAKPIPKDVLLVLDHSGSMEGEKFTQVQKAARYVLGRLNPEDRFDLLTFSTSVETFAPGLRPASDASSAQAWLDGISAAGSTDINRALLEAAAIADPERPTYLLFLTDGLPTEGETDTQKILTNFSASARPNLRLFSFGVGYDVDTTLLDSLAQQNHGASTYVRPGDALDEILSAFYAHISAPVLTDLKLTFSGISAYDLYPEPLPDLFIGSQIVLTGRYREGGAGDVTLTGQVNGQTQTFSYPAQSFDVQTRDPSASLASLPRLWATRKIGTLLSRIRLQGADQETIDQIVHLSIRYGIVTPYTSYLVTEPSPLGAAAQSQIAQDQMHALQMAPAAPSTGQTAVNKAADESALAAAGSASALPAGSQSQIRAVGSRTFVLTQGVWTDTAYDPQKMHTTQVAFLSADYFNLAAAHPELAAALALGERVVFVSGSTVYEVVAADQATQPLVLPTPTASPTSQPAASTASPWVTPPPTAAVPPTPSPTPTGFVLAPTLFLWPGIALLVLLLILIFRRKF
jgi:Ca-activated chloride channel family protein